MKHLVKQWLIKNVYLLLAIALFAVAFILNKYVIDTTAAQYYARAIEKRIIEKERDFMKLSYNSTLINSLASGRYSESTLQEVLDSKRGYGIFMFRRPAYSQPILEFWNSQVATPPAIPQHKDTTQVLRLNNGVYIHHVHLVKLENGQAWSIEALIPILSNYFVEIENLPREFVGVPDAGRRVDFSTSVTDFPVRDADGDILFYLKRTSDQQQQHSIWTIILVVVGVVLLFFYLHQVADRIREHYGLWYGVLFLAGTIVLLRLGTYYFPGVLDLRQFELFDPSIYGSSFVLSSLGDLLLNSLLFTWIIMFINRRFDVSQIRAYQESWKNWLLLCLVLAGQVIFTFTIAGIIQSLIADAQISFNVTNFFSLTQYSFIGFIILATLALSYFFLSQILLTLAGILVGDRNYITFIITGFIGLLLLSFNRNNNMVELNLFVLPWLVVFVWLMQLNIFSGLNLRLNISEVLFWLAIFSASITAVIVYENRKIEFDQRQRFAERLISQADPSSERLLSIAMAYLDNNFLAPNFRRFEDQQTNAMLKDSIVKTNFTAYLNKYDTKVFTFNALTEPLYNSDAGSFDTLNTIFKNQGKSTSIPDLHYFERSFDKFSYIFRKEVVDANDSTVGYFFVLSDPKRYKSDALIPELFKQTRELLPEYSNLYSYAIYDSLRLISHYNDYAFPTQLSSRDIPREEYKVISRGDYEELWFHNRPDKVVVIAVRNSSFMEAITLFAYLFSTFLFLLAVYRITSILIRSRLQWSELRKSWELSIRSQIHSTIISVSLLSFVVIGIATILYFVNRYHRNNQDRLTRAIQIMGNEVKKKIINHSVFNDGVMLYEPGFNDEMKDLMSEISEIHGTDVNLYDTLGDLKVSSNADIYYRGVLSEKMNPLAFFRLHTLHQVQTVTDEQVGKINYLSIYSPVRDENGNAVAYLNIPSYSTQGELKQEISNFLVTIITLNAFIFLIAGAIAVFITNRITSSFTIITQKMRDINLRQVNQEIEWKRNDEIGVLVKEYNKMVQKLEEGADTLAKSEREGAWRQMARQVAHEIKNPLTPMKLSIQYLQKAIDNNSPDVKTMTANVARTLVEQIDHLSKIASDFSQFANIGNPRNEVFDLHELLYSLSSLYQATENLDFSWDQVPAKVMVFADKTQLNRLFTNLMQNALEASADRELRVIRMDERLEDDHIIISVKDNGEGIPEQTRSKIFTPNFTTKSSGTGLGLAMSKGIVEQARGDIWFTTVEGEGTVFCVKLPLLRTAD
ncbi:HAMP domain-containing histidine kinase [Pseudoflavitalea sp. G-6-1-2]|uniref:sensor histidine kinase n=1 Tax=Pseudoflavitalea sp. G-6-1-2 TaxID=2728841 RepID=UPI00146D7870|nr:HAMP domain-containing sensor histidine kinase [Pseudoflavitalea sp. G-6-1-2]NML22061.1 HAMP domain-containing histidine kinase [Pseudoflavitalea sp. G-6-1-2]